REDVIARLRGMAGLPYVWGGNIPAGLPNLLDLYPPAGVLDDAVREQWQLRGVDCSGLLYASTDGHTPRNTSALVAYGRPVHVTGRSAATIAGLLAPLDLLVWPGHVLIVLDHGQVIESRLMCNQPSRGVVIRPLTEALAGLLAKRRPADRLSPVGGSREFVVRRWYP
ncbi:MAG TPA: peptidoglycan endopeptidase, partial [Geobacteraceae bacterium]